MQKNDKIVITKARVHNLKNVSVKIPKNTLTVITGPSGSGKSSLAFDTIYVEGQRRYIESLSSYARQFLGQYSPPEVESIKGLSPAIAIDQKTVSRNPRSTVGTITEIYDYFRILFARVGTMYCPETGKEVKKWSPHGIVKELVKYPGKTKIQVGAKIELHPQKNEELLKEWRQEGIARVRLGETIELTEEIDLKVLKKHKEALLVLDRVTNRPDIEKRLTDSVEYALKLGNGVVSVLIGHEEDEIRFHDSLRSPVDGRELPELEPRLFSFNSPVGACPTCNGIGRSKVFLKEKMIFDPQLSINQGGITPLARKTGFLIKMVETVARNEGINLNTPYKDLPSAFKKLLFHGTDKVYQFSFVSKNSKFHFKKAFPGLLSYYQKRYLDTHSEMKRKMLEKYMDIKLCPDCNGLRLNPYALNTKINKKSIHEFSSLPVKTAFNAVNEIELSGEKAIIGEKVLKEIQSRLKFLIDVGLDYLTLDRSAGTLSGGEAQRIRLATQLGQALSGVLYVLDEPSIGLHQKDNMKLIKTLKNLRNLGNTVIVVEHDEETIRQADHIVDLGPGAGVQGGHIMGQGPIDKIDKNKKSITGLYLSKARKIEIPGNRITTDKYIKIRKAKANNLKSIDVDIPLDGLTCVTGVSGSGKSTLVHEIMVPAIKNYLKGNNDDFGTNFQSMSGIDQINSIIELDQSPIGRTPHSNPATYSGLFDGIRELFSKLPESQIRGYRPGRFSFNVKGGRCEECEGNGLKKIEMHFLPDVYIVCSECKGSRFNRDTLSIKYKGLNISDVLNLTIDEAYDFFKNHPRQERILGTLKGTGLGYMKLGQPATTLSGGEAQRLKLAKELAKRTKGHCFYVLDEPTTGLHFEDIKILLTAFQKLVDKGHGLLVIEHNIDVIKTADYIIDLGPEGGDLGGEVVACGTPEELAKSKKGHTSKFLKAALK